MTEKINPYDVAKAQIDIVAKEMGLDKNITEYLKRIELNFSLTKQNKDK